MLLKNNAPILSSRTENSLHKRGRLVEKNPNLVQMHQESANQKLLSIPDALFWFNFYGSWAVLFEQKLARVLHT